MVCVHTRCADSVKEGTPTPAMAGYSKWFSGSKRRCGCIERQFKRTHCILNGGTAAPSVWKEREASASSSPFVVIVGPWPRLGGMRSTDVLDAASTSKSASRGVPAAQAAAVARLSSSSFTSPIADEAGSIACVLLVALGAAFVVIVGPWIGTNDKKGRTKRTKTCFE